MSEVHGQEVLGADGRRSKILKGRGVEDWKIERSKFCRSGGLRSES